ncbi:MAG: RidA family protein [Acidimicrobiia bacterium]|nr:RidA family protein [Acidimicrobiia bacterium]
MSHRSPSRARRSPSPDPARAPQAASRRPRVTRRANRAIDAATSGSHRPARSTIGVAALPAGGAVEIEAWAYVPVDHKPMTKAKPAPSRAAKTKPARAANAQPTPSRAVKASKKK